jgi:hypothetical protein
MERAGTMATAETPIKLESRVAILEEKVTQLQRKLDAVGPETKPWWQNIVGAFADDPAFEEATRLGREYRESLRPRKRSKSSKPVQPSRGSSAN